MFGTNRAAPRRFGANAEKYQVIWSGALATHGNRCLDRGRVSESAGGGATNVTETSVTITLLLALLDGTTFANAVRRNGRPCRIRLPDDPKSRAVLVDAHVRGEPATLTFHADGHDPWQEYVDAVVLGALCPAVDAHCRWIGVDLDGTDHGDRGLADPVHAARNIAERAADFGLMSGLLVARSCRGRGQHVFLVLPEPVVLPDAVIGVAALAAAAFKVASSDVLEYGAQHAFNRGDGTVARLGDTGAVELLPRSTVKPPYGWALALPGAGAFATHGGGVIVDPFTDQPTNHQRIPRCGHDAWSRFIADAQEKLPRTKSAGEHAHPVRVRHARALRAPLDRIDPRTRAFIDGHAADGGRNAAAFAASANLLGCGLEEREAQQLILLGSMRCGLPPHEATTAFKSAVKALARRKLRL